MNEPFIILDAGVLCHRTFNSMGGLMYGDQPTGVIYGFMKDCQELSRKFNTKRFLFCFDHGKGIRYSMYEGYKKKRQEEKDNLAEEEKELRRMLQDQMSDLKTKWLPSMGFRNVFYQKGYEGDDMIACLAAKIPEHKEAIIITTDKDMLQCIRPNVHFYNPNSKTGEVYTEEHFEDEWGVTPSQWALVKGMAGCSTDEVKGIKGVGEKTAVKFLTENLGEHTAAFQKIQEALDAYKKGMGVLAVTMPLVQLPLKGAKVQAVRKDNYSQDGFEKMCKELGFRSLLPKTKGLIKGRQKTFWDA